MKVSNVFDPRLVAETYTRRSDKNEPKRVNASLQQGMGADRVELSERGQELQLYRRWLKDLSEVRAEVVKEVKKQLKEGTYKVDEKKVADGIITEYRLDKRLDEKA